MAGSCDSLRNSEAAYSGPWGSQAATMAPITLGLIDGPTQLYVGTSSMPPPCPHILGYIYFRDGIPGCNRSLPRLPQPSHPSIAGATPLQSMAMPTAMHFLNRQSWHWLRVILSMTQEASYLQEYVGCRFFWMVRRKKPCRGEERNQNQAVLRRKEHLPFSKPPTRVLCSNQRGTALLALPTGLLPILTTNAKRIRACILEIQVHQANG